MTEKQVSELIEKRLKEFADDVADGMDKIIGIIETSSNKASLIGEKALHIAENMEKKVLDGDITSSSNIQGVSKNISKDIAELKTTIEELKEIYKML